jgi:hypothetical protein
MADVDRNKKAVSDRRKQQNKQAQKNYSMFAAYLESECSLRVVEEIGKLDACGLLKPSSNREKFIPVNQWLLGQLLRILARASHPHNWLLTEDSCSTQTRTYLLWLLATHGSLLLTLDVLPLKRIANLYRIQTRLVSWVLAALVSQLNLQPILNCHQAIVSYIAFYKRTAASRTPRDAA